MNQNTDRNENIKKIHKLIKDIQLATLTTVEDDGMLHSRPMATQQFEFDGDLWLFTKADAPNDQKDVSVSGTAQLVRDRKKNRRTLESTAYSLVSRGLNDPELAQVRLSGDRNRIGIHSQALSCGSWALSRRVVTGKSIEAGESKKIEGLLVG